MTAAFGDTRLPVSFWAKVQPEPNTGCWLWVGASNATGYGFVKVHGRTRPAHRVSYEALTGPVIKPWQIDHLCRVRLCVNPDHLQVVSSRENSLRGTHPHYLAHLSRICVSGRHCLDKGQCRACHNERRRELRHKKRAAVLVGLAMDGGAR